MRRSTVLLAEDEPITRLDLVEILETAGYEVVGRVGDGRAAVEMAARLRPDAILLDIRMPKLDGLQAARAILSRRRCPVLLLTAYSDRHLVEAAREIGVAGYLVKPVRKEDLLPALEIALGVSGVIEELTQRVHLLESSLAARKEVERAKGLIMKRFGLDEEEAFRHLRRLSMDARLTLGETARRILEAPGRMERKGRMARSATGLPGVSSSDG